MPSTFVCCDCIGCTLPSHSRIRTLNPALFLSVLTLQLSKYMLSREVCLNSAFAFLEAFGGPVAPSVEARYW
jgi:hypothetical protein